MASRTLPAMFAAIRNRVEPLSPEAGPSNASASTSRVPPTSSRVAESLKQSNARLYNAPTESPRWLKRTSKTAKKRRRQESDEESSEEVLVVTRDTRKGKQQAEPEESDSDSDDEQFDEEEAAKGWKQIKDGELLRALIKKGKGLKKDPANPRGFTVEGREDGVVLDANPDLKSKKDRRRREWVENELYPMFDKALNDHLLSHSTDSGTPSASVLRTQASLETLREFTASGSRSTVQTRAVADRRHDIAVSPFGRQVLETFVLAVKEEEEAESALKGLSDAVVDLLVSVPRRWESEQKSRDNSALQHAFKAAKKACLALVERSYKEEQALTTAKAAVERLCIEWTGKLFGVIGHASNYAPLKALESKTPGIKDDTWTGRKMAQKGSVVCNGTLINGNGFAADPYHPEISSSRFSRTTPIPELDLKDGQGVEIRGRCTRYFYDAAALAVMYRSRAGTVDAMIGPQAQSISIAASKANRGHGFKTLQVVVPLDLVGVSNEHGTYPDKQSPLEVLLTYKNVGRKLVVTGITFLGGMWVKGYLQAEYLITPRNLNSGQLADAIEATMHYLVTGEELATTPRSNLAQASVPRAIDKNLPCSPRDFGIRMNQLRQAEKELQNSLDPDRRPLHGLVWSTLPDWLRTNYAPEFPGEISLISSFLDFDELPSSLQKHYRRQSRRRPEKYGARLQGISPLSACMSIKSLRGIETMRQDVQTDANGVQTNGIDRRNARGIVTQRKDVVVGDDGVARDRIERKIKQGINTLQEDKQYDAKRGKVLTGTQRRAYTQQDNLRADVRTDSNGVTTDGMTRRALAIAANLRKDISTDDQGTSFSGTQKRGRGGAASRAKNKGTLVWTDLASYIWRNRATLLKFGFLNPKTQKKAVGIDLPALKKLLRDSNNSDFEKHLDYTDKAARDRIN